MDKTIRRNEICVIGLPRCDFVFSSTRTCFIAYGFEESPLEMTIPSSKAKCSWFDFLRVPTPDKPPVTTWRARLRTVTGRAR